jgi:DamX protein
MVEHDTFTVSVKKTPTNHAPILSLITQERTQKLELLIHLLTNLPQSLVVCGPEGIGKTTLFKILQEREKQAWRYCALQGHAGLSFEVIQARLNQISDQVKGVEKTQFLSVASGRSAPTKCVLIIDDAGTLVPGLITAIIQYAASQPALRVIFALTHDELHVQSKSDRALDDCHVIEIPPLSEKQCGEFLQVLSNQTSTAYSMGDSGQLSRALVSKAINEHFIEIVYRETHGIPGKIIGHIPNLSTSQQGGQGKWLMAFAVAGLAAITLAVQYYSSSPINQDKKAVSALDLPTSASLAAQSITATPLVLPVAKAANLDNLTPEPTPVITVEEPLAVETVNPAETMVTVMIEPQQSQQAADVAERKLSIPDPIAVEQAVVQPTKVISAPQVSATQKTPEVSINQKKKPESENPLSQTGDYTLQLMVLSKQASIDDIQRKYPVLRSGFRVVKTVAGGQERFSLLYGSFDSAELANKARQALPPEFRNALVRKAGSR